MTLVTKRYKKEPVQLYSSVSTLYCTVHTVCTATTMIGRWRCSHGYVRWLVYGTVRTALEVGWSMALFAQL